jgi:hypothetical protein
MTRLDVGESMSGDDCLGGNSANGEHGQSAVEKFGIALLLEGGGVLGCKLSPAKVTRLALSLHGGNNGGGSDDEVEKTDPENELEHGTRSEESIVGSNGARDGLEGVQISRDADKVGGNKTNDGQHGSASVTELGLTEEGEEWLVGLSKLQL